MMMSCCLFGWVLWVYGDGGGGKGEGFSFDGEMVGDVSAMFGLGLGLGELEMGNRGLSPAELYTLLRPSITKFGKPRPTPILHSCPNFKSPPSKSCVFFF